MNHTWHPNTFGLIYGETTKTACSKRRKTTTLVPQLETTCPQCQETVLKEMLEQQARLLLVMDLRKAGLIPSSGGSSRAGVRRYAVI